jgi:hypothetical protein
LATGVLRRVLRLSIILFVRSCGYGRERMRG